MSRKNKVNPDHYKVAGRLSPDDLARERMKQNAREDSKAWHERRVPAAARTIVDGAKPGDETEEDASGGVGPRAPGGAHRSAGAGRPASRGAKTQVTNKGGRTKKPVARGPGAAARASRTIARKELPARARAARTKRQMTATGGARAAKKR